MVIGEVDASEAGRSDAAVVSVVGAVVVGAVVLVGSVVDVWSWASGTSPVPEAAASFSSPPPHAARTRAIAVNIAIAFRLARFFPVGVIVR
ncbi:MAG: hypothetical protein AAGD35_22705 [Actinomycetota bacterium]